MLLEDARLGWLGREVRGVWSPLLGHIESYILLPDFESEKVSSRHRKSVWTYELQSWT